MTNVPICARIDPVGRIALHRLAADCGIRPWNSSVIARFGAGAVQTQTNRSPSTGLRCSAAFALSARRNGLVRAPQSRHSRIPRPVRSGPSPKRRRAAEPDSRPAGLKISPKSGRRFEPANSRWDSWDTACYRVTSRDSKCLPFYTVGVTGSIPVPPSSKIKKIVPKPDAGLLRRAAEGHAAEGN
jgi:hypothetical protein